ncbi:hypothetical protein PAEPH01_1866 [Pancytospora epiphaga]|nr:hypothetical protein PAEPH01_1866 [Pancytospora epiphaga]
MRPFLMSCLKCSKCGSSQLPKLQPVSIEKVPSPATPPSLEFYKDKADHLVELVESISRIKQGVIDVDEANIYEFVDNGEEEVIASLLYGVDVIEGSIFCVDCGDKRSIKNSILHCIE